MKLGYAIKKLRKQKGIKQLQLAASCGISQTYLSQIESDSRNPTLNVLQKISENLGVPFPVLGFLALTEKDVLPNKTYIFNRMKNVLDLIIEDIFVNS